MPGASASPGEHFRQMVDRTGGLPGLTGREDGRGDGLDDGAQLCGIAGRVVTCQTQGPLTGAPSPDLPRKPETHRDEQEHRRRAVAPVPR